MSIDKDLYFPDDHQYYGYMVVLKRNNKKPMMEEISYQFIRSL